MNFDLFYGIITNSIFLLAIVLLYYFYLLNNSEQSIKKQVLFGGLLSYILLVILNTQFTLASGLLLDTRSIALSVIGLFFGPVPALFTVTTAVIARLIQGGTGMFVGSLVAIYSGAVGVGLRQYRKTHPIKNTWKKYLEYYLFGFVVHIGMMLLFFLLPRDSWWVIGDITPYVLFIYPVITFGVCLLHNNRFSLEEKNRLLFQAQNTFVKAISSAPVPIAIHNEHGEIFLLNQSFTKLSGYSTSHVKTVKEWAEYAFPKGVDQVLNHCKEAYENINHTLTADFPITTMSGEIRRWHFHTSNIGTNEEGELLFISIARDITEQKQLEEQLTRLSFRDKLTGLYNRRFYEEELSRLYVKRNLPFSLIVADVNSLKLVNDSFGHNQGDLLLQTVAKTITSICREDDIISRTGGDEFVILLPKTTESETILIANRLQKQLQGKTISNVSISISLGHYTSESTNTSTTQLFNIAEKNMYQEKLMNSSGIKKEIMKSIVESLFKKDTNTKKHSEEVSALAEQLANELHLDDISIQTLKTAGYYHDVGKIVIPETVLNKAGSLTELERDDIQKHPETGYRILHSAGMSHIADIILDHHEWYNGEGYPQKKQGEDISLHARIISVCDAFSAMTNTRNYREPYNTEYAIQELINGKNTQFDPYIVDAFIRMIQTPTN